MLLLPTADNEVEPYVLSGTSLVARAPKVPLSRVAFAAAHVVTDPLRERDPWNASPAIDWDETLAFRKQLWDQGLGLAEAMDTAQRGMGVGWATARELVERTMRAAKEHPLKPRVASGAGTDHLELSELKNAEAIRAAYETQMEALEAAGSQVILMASRAFPAIGADQDTYYKVYRHLIDGAAQPVILHWLGDMFDPALRGYWGKATLEETSSFVQALIAENPSQVDGIKISLLSQEHEEEFRGNLPDGVRLYTGDDFHYADLIAGDGTRHSDALLGIFAAIAPAASQALEALALGDMVAYEDLFAPTVPLSREIFRAPTRFYKAGIAFMSWLNGYQSHFIMPGGLQSSRDIVHYAQIFRLADKANLLLDPDLVVHRMKCLLEMHGICE